MLKKLSWGHTILSTPGPTPIPDLTLHAVHQQAIDIYGQDAIELTDRCKAGLRAVFGTSGEVFINIANGHGSWESVLTNLFGKGDKLLILAGGRFPGLWAEMATKLGLDVEVFPGDWRYATDVAQLELRLRQDRDHAIRGVLAVHVDTAASIANDIPAISRAVANASHPALLVVDAIASLATAPFEMDQWGVDVAISASQKGLMMSPGLSFVAANAKALDAHRHADLRTPYWDWTDRLGIEHYKVYCGTAAIQSLLGLDHSLHLIQSEGLENIIERHRIVASAVHAAIEEWSKGSMIEFNVKHASERSASVTTILVNDNSSAQKIRDICRDQFNVILGSGMGHLKARTFRIAHMGYFNPAAVLGVLAAVEASLVALDLPCGQGGVARAIAVLAKTCRADTTDQNSM
ncbi:MAG TPA: alanine--glyoxylate aminotransferase family protein [Gammaproteobacteria bacterium]|nr:alanine--glyoxylate aminotransferase family protein [Gammaproteobacteria bacterium]HIM99310.1 alanine--glyoxylate aminotransferase family protein [Gammaproteobacteria bacterium]